MPKMYFNDKIVVCEECGNDDFLCRLSPNEAFLLCQKCNNHMSAEITECVIKKDDYYTYG
ncbi:MAG: hypothetical protein ACTSRE_04275 [Promethearchaeota archaeon]